MSSERDTVSRPAPPAFLSGGGEMGRLTREFDWSKTPLGAVEGWPPSLRTSVCTCLNCSFPILIGWGQDLVMLYNDAFRPILGDKHPWALGRKRCECRSGIWNVVGPMLERVLTLGEAAAADDLLLLPERNGYPEECCLSFSCSPIFDESGAVGGVFCSVIETTDKAIGEGRFGSLRDLAALSRGGSVAGACAKVAAGLAANPPDRPFTLPYEPHESSGTIHAEGAMRRLPGETAVEPEALPPGGLPAAASEPGLEAARALLADGNAGMRTHLELARLRREAGLVLREREQQLALALEAGQLGFWDWDVRSGHVRFGGRWAAMLGYDPVDIEPHVGAWEQLVHPDEQEYVRAVLADHLQGRTDFYECEHRMRHKDGSWRWILDRGQVVERDAEGGALRAIGTHADVTSRREAEDSLREADRRKDEFLAMLAHELRNPLAPIRNALHVLRKSDGESGAAGERTRTLLTMMERQVNHLVRLVDDLLEVSRISRGKIELRKERTDLAAIVGHAVETSQPLIRASGHRLEISLPPESLPLDADPVRLAQVFANLLNNAAKYTAPGGHIRVAAERRGGRAVVSVRDTGEGIPPEMLPHVFELFTQLNRSIDRAQGGLGIGLALVRRLAGMHGGWVEARSEGPGRGSEFIVHLPLAGASDTDALEPEPPSPALRSPRRLLVVDDNRDAADSLALLLESLDAEVRVAYDGPSALETLAAFKPDVVLLDLGMPGMDGYEVARRIRQRPGGRELTLIALTGWGQDEDRRRTREAGFDHHLVKPADLEILQTLLMSSAGTADGHPGS